MDVCPSCWNANGPFLNKIASSLNASFLPITKQNSFRVAFIAKQGYFTTMLTADKLCRDMIEFYGQDAEFNDEECQKIYAALYSGQMVSCINFNPFM